MIDRFAARDIILLICFPPSLRSLSLRNDGLSLGLGIIEADIHKDPVNYRPSSSLLMPLNSMTSSMI